MSKNFRVTLNERLKDENFKSEYDALEPEYQLINAILDCRKEMNMTQKQLSEATGIAQGGTAESLFPAGSISAVSTHDSDMARPMSSSIE